MSTVIKNEMKNKLFPILNKIKNKQSSQQKKKKNFFWLRDTLEYKESVIIKKKC